MIEFLTWLREMARQARHELRHDYLADQLDKIADEVTRQAMHEYNVALAEVAYGAQQFPGTWRTAGDSVKSDTFDAAVAVRRRMEADGWLPPPSWGAIGVESAAGPVPTGVTR